MKPVEKTEKEWKKELSPEQFRILRLGATEPPHTGKFLHKKDKGKYVCAGCGNELFSSDEKFDSKCGWPSFWERATENAVILREDRSYGMVRTEVLCAKCGGHLGHVFEDGPKPTGLRYCINSLSLEFEAKK